jgi:TIR domain-containing protein/SIR2-like protein
MALLAVNTERLWDQVLQFIEEGRVIPVVGPELLTLEAGGRTAHLYGYLAERLAKQLRITSSSDDTLNTVVCRYLAEGGEIEDIYPALKRVMPPLDKLSLPAALIKLAEIRPLKLFVSTTFDPLLAQALNRIRYGGQPKTEILAFSPNSTQDLPRELEDLDRATVFHLFGRLSAVPDYAVTDEDLLEFMHALQSKTGRPERLFDAMVGSHLLIIGCAFSDWLARFFVRIGKHERLSLARGKTDVLVDERAQQDDKLVHFLQHFSTRTKVFPGGATSFVNELHSHWTAAYPQGGGDREPITVKPPPPDDMERGAVFLSYASEDRPTVALIRDALEQAGIDVWFDRDELGGGDAWKSKILRNIESCCLFIPIMSSNTLTPKRREFRTEWYYAREEHIKGRPDLRFIIPVTIDDTNAQSPGLVSWLREIQWVALPGGQATPEFVELVRTLFRDYQRSRVAAA